MNNFILNSVDTNSSEMGETSEYENPVDRFVIWAVVDFDINDQNYKETVVFDSGVQADSAIWENYDNSLFDVSKEQDKFLEDCLQKAEKALASLKAALADSE
ncbi:hypothetical protein [Teredinibacter purpureus]|uniref:hypothetical protein n=1 Tax=Teredinibacter purpureus TaxID=2731756 RepID=UPI0005F7C654|nr:hypothetical protein [Teredinibacter purpureus]